VTDATPLSRATSALIGNGSQRPCDHAGVIRNKNPLYFWHIPKTAGTSFTGWLESHFRPDELFPPHLVPDLRSTPDAEVAGRSLYRGHFGSELLETLEEPLTCVTLLREPRARTVSHLSHIWRAPDHYLHARVRKIGRDLAAVAADPVVRLAVTDMQARYLAVDPVGTERHRPPVAVPAGLLGQAQFELTPLPAASVLRRRARARLRRMAAFGFAEELDDFARQLAARLGWSRPSPLPRANAAPPDSSPWSLRQLSSADLKVIDSLNPVDGPLYRRARRVAATRRALRRAATRGAKAAA
jgi:hypothetical protein